MHLHDHQRIFFKNTILTNGELLEPYENIRKYIRKKGGGRKGGEGIFFAMGDYVNHAHQCTIYWKSIMTPFVIHPHICDTKVPPW